MILQTIGWIGTVIVAILTGRMIEGWRPYDSWRRHIIRRDARRLARSSRTVKAVITAVAPADVTYGWDEDTAEAAKLLPPVEDFGHLYRPRPKRRKRRQQEAELEADTFVGELHNGDQDTLGPPGTNGHHSLADEVSTEITSVEDIKAWGDRMRAEIASWGQRDTQPALPSGTGGADSG